MKKAMFAVLLGIIPVVVFGQTVSDDVLFTRASALVKGLRSGESWNKSIADLKKDFPDMKEVEPFKATEDAKIQTQEFGALYTFDNANGYKDKAKILFSFYQNKLYRVETLFMGHRQADPYLTFKVAKSFFNTSESSEVSAMVRHGTTTKYYYPIRFSYHFNDVSNNKYFSFVFTNMSIENKFYTDQNLLHPDYGYVNVTWGSSLKDITKTYGDLKEVTYTYTDIIDEDYKGPGGDLTYGLRTFVQTNTNSGSIAERVFDFYQDSLFEVSVEYKQNANCNAAFEKLQSIYKTPVPVNYQRGSVISFENPFRDLKSVASSIREIKKKQSATQKKQAVDNAEF